MTRFASAVSVALSRTARCSEAWPKVSPSCMTDSESLSVSEELSESSLDLSARAVGHIKAISFIFPYIPCSISEFSWSESLATKCHYVSDIWRHGLLWWKAYIALNGWLYFCGVQAALVYWQNQKEFLRRVHLQCAWVRRVGNGRMEWTYRQWKFRRQPWELSHVTWETRLACFSLLGLSACRLKGRRRRWPLACRCAVLCV